ncbi:MAG: YdbH domain-containing protein [Candidatus Omnitrophota bacterium]|nr:YdbH domain-containing protein [Candidatus Omnitrophota bacterium]
MRRRIFAKIFFISVILIIIFSLAAYLLAKPILLPIINKELHKVFKESSVSGFRLTRDFMEFQGIEIKGSASYDFKIKEARIYYSLNSIVDKKIEKVLLNEISVKINIGKDGLLGLYPFPGVASGGSGKFSIAKFEATNINLDLTKEGIKIKGKVSLGWDIPANAIDYVKLNITSLATSLFQAEGITLNAIQDQDEGEFYIKTINYNKLKIGDVVGKTCLKGNILAISPMLVSLFGGNVKGEFNISLDQDMNYNLRLNSQGLDIKRLVNEMEFNEKFDMTGRLDGEFSLSGKGQDIKDIKGYFSTDANGGMLVIKDKTFLENVAKQSNQSLDIIVESFRNYNYNNGIIRLGMENRNFTMGMSLDGKSGKRSLTVVLHDFNRREKP